MQASGQGEELKSRRCTLCGREAILEEWRCTCGGPLELCWEAPPFPAPVAGDRWDQWRYATALPIPLEAAVTLGEGMTPLVPAPWLGVRVHLKLEFRAPTGSFKDRGASVMLSAARMAGVTAAVDDSSGNAGAATAAYAAAAGIRACIFTPASASPEKLRQIMAYGAEVVRIPGPRERAAEAAMAAASPGRYTSHAWDPFFLQGNKTFVYELWEQGAGRLPEAVVTPVGQGALFLGAYLGLQDLRRWGRIQALPRLIGVQASACAPLVRLVEVGGESLPELQPAPTVAEGIATRRPVRWREIRDAVRATGGGLVEVGEAAITEELRLAGRHGVFIEPTSAAALAGYRAALAAGILDQDSSVVIALTGSGLKAAERVANLLGSL